MPANFDPVAQETAEQEQEVFTHSRFSEKSRGLVGGGHGGGEEALEVRGQPGLGAQGVGFCEEVGVGLGVEEGGQGADGVDAGGLGGEDAVGCVGHCVGVLWGLGVLLMGDWGVDVGNGEVAVGEEIEMGDAK